MEILLPFITLGILGLVFGALLGLAAKKFKVESDERTEKIAELLPGANCGGCGYAGCSALAEAIVSGAAKPNACSGCSGENIKKIADIMGVSAEITERKVAFVCCAGTNDVAKTKFNYAGISDCLAAMRYAGGSKACSYGCLGYGTCVNVCKFDAIKIADGVAVVDETRCTNCSACIKACPRKIIKSVPAGSTAIVKCMSKDKGAAVRDICTSGCIGCRICEKNCPEGAIAVADNIASVDMSKCTACGVCVEKCPKKIIEFVG